MDAVVESFDAESGGLSPGELRVCVDSLQPLIAEREYEDVRGFLLGLSETVERVGGMAHYHLPVEYDSEVVETYEPLFDAVVEIRWVSGKPEQRWHLTEPDITIDWLPL